MTMNEVLEINRVHKRTMSEIDSLFRQPRILVPAPEIGIGTVDSVLDLLMNRVIRRGDQEIDLSVLDEYTHLTQVCKFRTGMT